MKFLLLFVPMIIFSLQKATAQANFITPDTVCVNQAVNITNTSVGASSFYWNFCLASTNTPPEGVNMGNIGGIFDGAVYIDYVQENGNFYGFVTDNHAFKLYRLDFGTSLLNIPTVTDLGNFGGVIPTETEGLQVIKNEGKWYAIIVGGDPAAGGTSKIVKIEFGTNIANNTPVGTSWGNIGNLSYPHDLYLFDEGGHWYGFTVNTNNNTITRFDFSTSFSNNPIGTNLGNIGNLNAPTGVFAIKDNGSWYVFVTNANTSSLSRLNFGTSLLNIPVGTNLGNIGGIFHTCWDIYIMKYCGNYVGFVINAAASYGDLVKLDFNNNLNSTPSAISFGNIGNLSFPHCISKIFRSGPDLYTFIPNVNNHTLSRLKFPGCTASNIPNSTDQNPQPITYNTPGTYNINLTTDDGLPTQSAFCRNVVVMPELQHSPIKNLSFCSGDSVLLTSNFSSRNKWSNGNNNNSIYAHSAATYWVETTNGACLNRDSFIVTITPAPFKVNLGNDTAICSPQVLLLDAGNPGASYLWNNNSTTQTISIKDEGKYYVTVSLNSCKSSDTIQVVVNKTNIDFNYKIDICNPQMVEFSALGNSILNPVWMFGDGKTAAGSLTTNHQYLNPGNYNIKYTASNNSCSDTASKTISIGTILDDVILTPDTTICLGTTKQLRTKPSLNFCWNPIIYLDNPNSPNPVTSTPQSITYYFTEEAVGNNLILNGDFSAGNAGFTSAYNYANPNITEGQYFIGNNPPSWNGGLSPCSDHTTGTGNMMLINGAPVPGVEVWRGVVNVTPNTNFAFSTWIQQLYPENPAQLRFSINGNDIGNLITASLPTCTWTQFYTTWNSGSSTSAIISIVNKNTQVMGNDFALDDISFAPVFTKRDSVRISVENVVVKTNNDTSFCEGKQVQLNTTGAASYSWSPSYGLNNSSIANPVASPLIPTQYIVSGISSSGCLAKDTVSIMVLSKPMITLIDDTTICKNSSVQFFSSGGMSYEWSPASTLNNSSVSNPVASPLVNTVYYLTITGTNSCTNTDSVKVKIWPDPVFAINPPKAICLTDSIQLNASGGKSYVWQPNGSLNNADVSNPKASPQNTTSYSVFITDNCNNSTKLSTTITVLPVPNIHVTKSNDVDCITPSAQLQAEGGVSYNWSPAVNINHTNISNPLVYPHASTWYTVSAIDENGCSAKDSILISSSLAGGKGNFYIPNAFTPDNDGKNDCFGVKYWGEADFFKLSIYNRWGQLVFQTKNTSDCWDGNFQNNPQPAGVFIYQVSVKSACTNGVLSKTGYVTLIR